LDVDIFLKSQQLCLDRLGHHYAKHCFEQALLIACKQPILAPISP
jgi:hypothetical protein